MPSEWLEAAPLPASQTPLRATYKFEIRMTELEACVHTAITTLCNRACGAWKVPGICICARQNHANRLRTSDDALVPEGRRAQDASSFILSSAHDSHQIAVKSANAET